MIGNSSSNTARDSSFLCLLAIYAAHVVLFHVLDVAPRLADFQQRQLTLTSSPLHRDSSAHRPSTRIGSGRHNGTASTIGRDASSSSSSSSSSDILSGQLRHEVFTTAGSQLHWDSSSSMMDHHPHLTGYPKIDFDLLFLLTWIQRIKHVFATIALSSSTWGIISGCAIFLLTYTDRDNTLQI